ncbi:diphosphate--fructose-6-phosphate 1-phosphotransferase [Halobacillus sp. ACCC02827]|uniref:diphosphate--fructose-6-phosphate 1-phosphotransferase n=1 Tax=Halobacillus sp. ACCC02827 TaxID=3052090 RepID=UPI0025703194|nr:diphosphate--fructose-6-phosphate 1-phosphotransferase [Halobacillus sp. ACCC02827]WJE15240.1 diphosphate--fructose-6-phosphate 1-phosphotransferase [Halobacillus sp. ACCC02827]
MMKIAIGQAGGPTAVINATLAGFVESVKDTYDVTFVEDGYEGLVEERFRPGDSTMLQWVVDNKDVPGACLRSGRYAFDDEAIRKSVVNLAKHHIDVLVFIGGNGTMEALYKVKQEAEKQGVELKVLGLPKTVDNDLGATDHAPGFASAAKYIAQTTKDMSRDLYAMNNFEQVRVLETMGRNAGWLAAASGAFREYEEEGPHFIAIPEKPIDKQLLMDAVRKALDSYGYALLVVSEGVQWEQGEQTTLDEVNGRSILGGISTEIANFIKQECNVTTRAELLGMNQRSCSTSRLDADEAYQIGWAGGRWLQKGYDGCMVAIERKPTDCYTIELKPVKLEDVIAEEERLLPPAFIEDYQAYYRWLSPLLGGDPPSYPPVTKRRVEISEYGY